VSISINVTVVVASTIASFVVVGGGVIVITTIGRTKRWRCYVFRQAKWTAHVSS